MNNQNIQKIFLLFICELKFDFVTKIIKNI